MRKKVKNVFWLIIFATIASGFISHKEMGAAKEYKTKTDIEVPATPSSDEDNEGDTNNNKSGSFLKNLKTTIEDLNKKSAESKLVTNSMELTMQCGFENMVKYERNICIQSTIANNGDNFVGYMQIVIPSYSGNNDNVMYQKEISIPAGETKNITFPLSPEAVGIRYNVRIVDEQGKEVVAKELVPNFQYSADKLFVGVLTDEKDYLGYLSQTDQKVFYLDKDKLPDEETALDTLDIIVINNFNTGNLSEEQYNALKTWVNNGGSLVIGTGTTGSKTLDIFKDDFISGTFGDVDSEGVMSLKLEDSQEITVKKASRTFYHMKKGLGNVLVCSRDLGMEYTDWATVGKSIVNELRKSLSDSKTMQTEDYYDGSYYDILEGLRTSTVLQIPSVGKYAFVLIIYILLTGPFLYLILKKIDKRNLLWGLVPVSAVIFGIGIYALGSETRLEDPFVGYMNFYQLDGSGKDQGEEDIFFSITMPTNEKYTFELPETTKISCLNENYMGYGYAYTYDSNQQYNKENKWKYKTAINYGATGTTIQLKEYSTFSSAYFKSRSTHIADGTYDYNLKAYGHKMSGTFTNNLGYDLERAIIVCDQRLYCLDDVKNGETVDLGTIDEKKIYNISTADCVYQGDLLYELSGGEPYSSRNKDSSIVKRYRALSYMFNYHFTEIVQGSELIAFTEEESGEGFVQQMDLDCNGMKIIEIPLDVDRTSGKNEFIGNLDEYTEIIEGDMDTTYRYSYTEEALFQVQYNEGDNIKSI